MVFENLEDAERAIIEYHGALLDNKVLTVEHDLADIVKVAKIQNTLSIGQGAAARKGKTLRVGGSRRGGRQ